MIPVQCVSYQEFLQLNESDDRLEYIDGEVYCLASPTIEHQRALLNIATELRRYFNGKECEPFISPLDVLLKNENDEFPSHVQPDIFVVCGKNGINETQYVGVPSLIIEIVSPSNTSYDRITKFNLYMRYGVKEYWLVNPKFRTIEVNILNDGLYEQIGVYKDAGIALSTCFSGLAVSLKDIF